MIADDARFAAKRLGILMSGEAIQSCLHFALNVVFMHVMSQRDYGLFAIVFVIGGIGLSFIRALASIPVSVYVGRERGAKASDFFDGVFAAGAVVAAAVMAMAVAGILFLSTPDAAMAGGCFVGLWCLRSHFRTAFFAAGRRNAAIVGDMIFAGVGAALCLVMFLQGASSLAHAFWILASANLLGIATMHLNARRVPILLFDRGFRACYRHLGARLAWSFASVATTNLQGQGIVLLVAGLVGPAAYAPIAAVLVFFVPLRIFGAALLNMIQPRFSADCARGDFQRVFNAAQSWSLTLGAMTFVYSACLLAVAPYLRTQALAGAPVELLCFLAALGNVGAALYNVPRAALEVLMRFRAIALVTAAGAICGGAAISLILWEVSNSWALGGAAIGEAVVLFGFWGSLLREARARGAISGFSGTHAIRLARSQTFAMFNKVN